MSQENVEIVRRAVRAFLENDFETWFGLASPGFELYPRPEEPGVKERYEGWDEVLEYLVNWYSGWKEYTAEAERFIDRGDWVLVEMNEVGIAESGLRIEQRFAHAFEIKDGKATKWRMFGPLEEALEAVGLSEQDAPADS